MTQPSTETATSNFDLAIGTYSADALGQFQSAYRALHDPKNTDANAQSKYMGAFTQLSGAAQMQAEQRNRAGFEAVVDLMQTTAVAAEKITAKLVGLLHAEPSDLGQPVPDDYRLIDELKDTLDVLARLSPSAVWTTPSGSSRSNQ